MEDERAIDDKEFCHLKDITAGWGLFFSPDFDITQTQQRVTFFLFLTFFFSGPQSALFCCTPLLSSAASPVATPAL